MPFQPIADEQLLVKSTSLHVPDLEDVTKVITKGLEQNFQHVSVKVAECPDLTEEPTVIASRGLCGKPRLLEVGGNHNMIPEPNLSKIYDIKDFPKLACMEEGSCLLIGAGAGPYQFIDRCCEMMPNILINENKEVERQCSTIARTYDDDNASSKLIPLPVDETTMSLLGNLFLSQGKPGNVLEIRCRTRQGEENFVSCIRQSLALGFPGKPVGLGGVFTVTTGKVKTHVMPDFSKKPLHTLDDINDWLNFYEMDAPFTALSCLVSMDLDDLDIRLEHSHGYNRDKEQGGHYHHDTTPDVVEYLAYYNVAEYIFRVDQPVGVGGLGKGK